MSEPIKMTVNMPMDMASFGAYEINLLAMAIEIAFNLQEGCQLERAPRVLRLAADMIEAEHC